MLSKALFRYQLFVFRWIFLQTLCCLVVSHRELHPQVHKEIINLTAWFAVLYQRNYFIFLQRVCSKVILPGVLMGAAILFTSLQLQLAEPYHVVQRKLPTYTWYGRCHLVSGEPGYVWFVEPYHVVPLKSSAAPKAWNLRPCCFIFLHNTVANMPCRLFDDRKYMDIYLPILQEYCYLGKQKNCLYFLASTCEHLWPSPSHLVNFSNWLISDIFTGFVRTFCTFFLKVY